MIDKAKVNKPIVGQAFHFRKDEKSDPSLRKYEGQPFTIEARGCTFGTEQTWVIRFNDGEIIAAFAEEIFP